MDIEIELDTLMDLHDDWENFSLPVQRGTARERYLDQRKKIEDEFQRLHLVEERVAELEDALDKCKKGDE